ncbi:hypothetical protein BGX30_004120, partial [Mortierella sp. GBA39]
MAKAPEEVKVWEERVEIPTYEAGKPDPNPMFLEKRVYQGSSGRVYPLPVIDKIYDEKVSKSYRIIFLENEYVQIQVMPEIGGRIYRAVDKTNGYDFVYHNQVIKPALVGLAGPWISGGIEFNWPQHHRPKSTAQLYNRTAAPQTFLWWANPAVAVNDHTQSVFPPDVHAVFDHGKRDVSKFPIATGTYYKMDYSAGVDISKYSNIPVPTSYMAYHSDYNFVGGYDHGVGAGLLHVANRHVSPGKKQWTWGHGEFGKAWDRNLTDEDGPYIELMTGVYTDNQPDFSWLAPYEEKSFKQYFMPYKKIGLVKNASIDAAVNLETADGQALVQVYATSVFDQGRVLLKSAGQIVLDKTVKLSPSDVFQAEVNIGAEVREEELRVIVLDADGRELVSYRSMPKKIEQIPDPAKAIEAPELLPSTEALYLAGLHLEQYRHATREPEAYYLEGLKRDPGDIRLNNAYGLLLLRRGCFEESEVYFRKAIETLTRHNARPYDSEPFYHLGQTLKWQGRLEEAYAVFYKSVWTGAWQAAGYFALAQIACGQAQYDEALELAETLVRETIRIDPVEFAARNELIAVYRETGRTAEAQEALGSLAGLMRGDAHNYIALAQDYADAGQYADALEVLGRIVAPDQPGVYPMVRYYQASWSRKNGQDGQADAYDKLAAAADPA